MAIRIRRPLDRKTLKSALTSLARLWQKLETQWAENPGYVAAATTGLIGIVLALSLIVNAGLESLSPPPDDENVAQAESNYDFEDDLGDPADQVIRRLRRENDEELKDLFAAEDRESRPSMDPNDPFDDEGDDRLSRAPARINIRDLDNDEPLEDEADKFQPPIREETDLADLPRNRQPLFEDEEEEESPVTQEPPAQPEVARTIPRIDMGTTEDSEADNPEDDPFEADLARDDRDRSEPDAENVTPPREVTREPAFLQTNGELDAEAAAREDSRLNDSDDEIVGRDARPRPTEPEMPREEPAAETKPEPKSEVKPDVKPEVKPEPPAVTKPEPKPEPTPTRHPPQAQAEKPTWQQSPDTRRSRAADTVVTAPAESSRPRTASAGPAPRPRQTPGKAALDLPLEMSIEGPGHVAFDGSCQYVLSVRNKGQVPLRNLVVSIELPPGLIHEVSQSLEQNVAAIPAGGVHRSLIKLRATQAGENTIQADILSGSRVAATLKAHVHVTPKAASRVVRSDVDDTVLR